jgi:hypothetical protein
VRSQVFMAVSMKMAVFWVVGPCSLVKVYGRFRGACCPVDKVSNIGKLLPDHSGQDSRRQPSLFLFHLCSPPEGNLISKWFRSAVLVLPIYFLCCNLWHCFGLRSVVNIMLAWTAPRTVICTVVLHGVLLMFATPLTMFDSFLNTVADLRTGTAWPAAPSVTLVFRLRLLENFSANLETVRRVLSFEASLETPRIATNILDACGNNKRHLVTSSGGGWSFINMNSGKRPPRLVEVTDGTGTKECEVSGE